MTDIKEIVEGFKAGKLEVIDTRDFDTYLSGHVPGTVLAPFYERRWPDELAEYLKGKKQEAVFLSRDDEIKKKIKNLLSERGLNVNVINYDEFKKAGNFNEATMENLSAEKFSEEIDNYTVIDVREPYEWSSGYIDGAELIPMEELFRDYGKLDKNKKYAVVCEHGNRSIYAAMFLADKGFKVANVEGGMNELRGRGII
ncbi:rhodanese-like domain-containing protein [Cuniculiplasma sp. SKW3]|uniref:rhodanese-like domain-containing protein n=1 Tax=Cuniculiplasma sp. SKW3 TaxID=3400170 RepID=UPI003FCF7904